MAMTMAYNGFCICIIIIMVTIIIIIVITIITIINTAIVNITIMTMTIIMGRIIKLMLMTLTPGTTTHCTCRDITIHMALKGTETAHVDNGIEKEEEFLLLFCEHYC